MAKKKKAEKGEDLPKGKVDEDGDEVIDLDEWDDNLDEDVYEDLSEIEDDMLADETEDEEYGPEVDQVEKMLRKIKCDPCPGLSSKPGCQVAKDFGCPKPDK
ncbi:MAG: hypothetical protein GF311_05510 [Candidatus Lokiarchaeota archaeon]|nr:hypothetical protein [Candidatus Lokiarchaeota archaeon]